MSHELSTINCIIISRFSSLQFSTTKRFFDIMLIFSNILIMVKKE